MLAGFANFLSPPLFAYKKILLFIFNSLFKIYEKIINCREILQIILLSKEFIGKKGCI